MLRNFLKSEQKHSSNHSSSNKSEHNKDKHELLPVKLYLAVFLFWFWLFADILIKSKVN